MKMIDPKEQHYRKAWNVICDRCGFRRKSFECRLEWTGLFVCAETCWEERHPMDSLKSFKDPQTVPIPRPEQPDNVILGSIYPVTEGPDA